MQIPPELCGITPFLSRAAELKTIEPIISYYCSFYAAQQAITLSSKSSECQSFLMNLLDDLEKEKSALLLKNEDIMTNDLVGFAHVSNFAYKVFSLADNEDRSGASSKKTAKTFLAASLFLEILSVFGEVDQDILEKIKYSKFKAAEIMKAIKSGKTPTPGGPMDQQHIDLSPTNKHQPIDEHATRPSALSSVESNPVNEEITEITEEEYKNPAHGLDYKTIQQAQKLAKFAISALQYDDVNNAIENLQGALRLLEKSKCEQE